VANVIEATASVIEEDQIIKDASCRGRRSSNARLFIASFIDVISFAKCFEIRSIAVEIEANVRDIFFKERQHRIWVPNVCSNT
jgi:hypothetical protein